MKEKIQRKKNLNDIVRKTKNIPKNWKKFCNSTIQGTRYENNSNKFKFILKKYHYNACIYLNIKMSKLELKIKIFHLKKKRIIKLEIKRI